MKGFIRRDRFVGSGGRRALPCASGSAWGVAPQMAEAAELPWELRCGAFILGTVAEVLLHSQAGVGELIPPAERSTSKSSVQGKTQSRGHHELLTGSFPIENRLHGDLQVGCSGLF